MKITGRCGNPAEVGEDWRPYTDGRWIPTKQGYVFESQEPWGWATYHYGNWMPTAGYGWVWVPGRTWYPSTVEWRTSRKNVPVNASYVGWAPIPPPDYVPIPAYAPSTYGTPGADALTSAVMDFCPSGQLPAGIWAAVQSGLFLYSQPVLAPPSYVPVFFRQTQLCPIITRPTYYAPADYGGRASSGAYS